jgi:hypothetical protein
MRTFFLILMLYSFSSAGRVKLRSIGVLANAYAFLFIKGRGARNAFLGVLTVSGDRPPAPTPREV